MANTSRGRQRRQTRQQGPEWADPTEAADWARDLSDAHLECRDERHDWRRMSARWLPEAGVFERKRKCRRCKTVKTQRLSELGTVVSNTYDYPDGYQTSGLGRLAGDSLAAMRLVSVHRELGLDAPGVASNAASNGRAKSNGKRKSKAA